MLVIYIYICKPMQQEIFRVQEYRMEKCHYSVFCARYARQL